MREKKIGVEREEWGRRKRRRKTNVEKGEGRLFRSLCIYQKSESYFVVNIWLCWLQFCPGCPIFLYSPSTFSATPFIDIYQKHLQM